MFPKMLADAVALKRIKIDDTKNLTTLLPPEEVKNSRTSRHPERQRRISVFRCDPSLTLRMTVYAF